MSAFSRLEIFQELKNTGVVPVFYHPDVEQCKQVIKACYQGGARVFEFTNRGEGAHRVFEELLVFVRAELPEMKLGVGSIVDAPTASLFMQIGADFVVAPILNQEMAKVCNRRKVAWVPGCGSLSEISQAEEWGAELVKIFPASQVGGPEFIKAIKGPCPWSNIMPTGGVQPTFDNIKGWIDAGAYCVGLGSQLFKKDATGKFNLSEIENTTAQVLEWIREIRGISVLVN